MLNAILQSIGDVIIHMEVMVKWWIPVIEALSQLEEIAHRMRAGARFDDNVIKHALTCIIRALGSYCDAVSLEDHFGTI